MTNANELRSILDNSANIAIVGLSNKPHRPSYFVGKYLLDHGYQIFPVNPMETEILGQISYPSLSSIPAPIDIVDCFRQADQMMALAQQAIAINAKCLWMQLGVTHSEAADLAQSAGLQVVMNRCTKIEHARLFGGLNWAGVNTGLITAKRQKKINL